MLSNVGVIVTNSLPYQRASRISISPFLNFPAWPTKMPDLSDPALFPTFRELPAAATAGDATAGSAEGEGTWTLLAQIKENMTITKPTLIATDRSGVDFAIIFEEPGFSLKGFRKGYTLLVPGARRTDREEVGKKAVVRVEQALCGGVRVSEYGV